jgi:two-component system chemotaxis response regulator CheY
MSAAAASAGVSQGERPAHTILIVDDALTIRQHARLVLEGHGFRVLEAKNGADGLEAARSERVDLILVDVNMPVMNGLEMVTELRKMPEYRSTPIFVLTTESSGETVMKGRAVGATAWVVKPLKDEVLLPAIRRVLKP